MGEKIEKELDILVESLDIVLERLDIIKNIIKKVNDSLGFTERCENIRKSIKDNGWDFIRKECHPDNNIDDLASYQLFQLYKYIYDDMRKRGEI